MVLEYLNVEDDSALKPVPQLHVFRILTTLELCGSVDFFILSVKVELTFIVQLFLHFVTNKTANHWLLSLSTSTPFY